MSRVLPAVLALWLLAGLTACSTPDSAEQRLRDTIDAMEAAAEAGDRSAFMDYVADDFGGQDTRMDREALGTMMRYQLFKHSRVTATITSMDIVMFDRRATVTMKVLLTGGPRAWMPETGEYLEVESGWRDDDGQWQLIQAQWN